MVLIHVPKPPKDAYDPDRPMGSLLKSQVDHMREAESKLPLRYRQQIETYVKAVRTEEKPRATFTRSPKPFNLRMMTQNGSDGRQNP